MFLVNHNEAQILHGRKKSRARAYHDVCFTLFDARPLHEFLGRGQARVENGNVVSEAASEAPDGLRGKRDFRHEHYRRLSGRANLFDSLQVNLAFARAGNTLDKDHLTGVLRCGLFNGCKGCYLAFCKGCGSLGCS